MSLPRIDSNVNFFSLGFSAGMVFVMLAMRWGWVVLV